MRKNVYSVGQVNTYIKNMFAQDFMLNRISVKGEVSNCKYHTSGHIYFTLKDASGTLNAIMFAGNRRTGLAFPMKEGDKVIVTGAVEVYERDGKYQIYAREIEPDGMGNLYLKFEALKRELEEMGMFADEYKKPIPKYAARIGVVTAPTGAAVQDIRNIAARRNPYVQLILYPALVQGDGAVKSIVNGIHALDALGVDVMIVGRGGGSIVGHQTDTTIADFVADLRAPTPSAAAELAVFDYRQVREYMDGCLAQMTRLMERRLEEKRQRVLHAKERLRYLSPANKLRENRKYAADLSDALAAHMTQIIGEKRHTLALFSGQLEGMSPVKKLSQGYSYVADAAGRAVTDASDVKPGDLLSVHLYKGALMAQVTETKLQNGINAGESDEDEDAE